MSLCSITPNTGDKGTIRNDTLRVPWETGLEKCNVSGAVYAEQFHIPLYGQRLPSVVDLVPLHDKFEQGVAVISKDGGFGSSV